MNINCTKNIHGLRRLSTVVLLLAVCWSCQAFARPDLGAFALGLGHAVFGGLVFSFGFFVLLFALRKKKNLVLAAVLSVLAWVCMLVLAWKIGDLLGFKRGDVSSLFLQGSLCLTVVEYWTAWFTLTLLIAERTWRSSKLNFKIGASAIVSFIAVGVTYIALPGEESIQSDLFFLALFAIYPVNVLALIWTAKKIRAGFADR